MVVIPARLSFLQSAAMSSNSLPSFTRAETALSFRATTLDADLGRKRLRERYLAVQFPDFIAARGRPEAVVRLARELFDEGERRLAIEVLTLGIQENPKTRAFVLALLELAYLAEDAALFSAAADFFHREFPGAPEHAQVLGMGALVAPRSPTFFGRARDKDGKERKPDEGARYRIPGWSLLGSPTTDDAASMDFRDQLLASH